MQIHHLQPSHAAQGLQRSAATPKSAAPVAPAAATGSGDQLELSSEAQQLSQTQAAGTSQEGSAIRTEKVAALRQAIAEGNYESPERLSAALDRLLDTFA